MSWRAGVVRRLLLAAVSWIVGVLVFWVAMTVVYGPVINVPEILQVARISGLALAVCFPLVYLPIFGAVVRNWRSDPRLALGVTGCLLTLVPFTLVVVVRFGQELLELGSFSAGEAVPGLLLFGVAGGLYGLFYR